MNDIRLVNRYFCYLVISLFVAIVLLFPQVGISAEKSSQPETTKMMTPTGDFWRAVRDRENDDVLSAIQNIQIQQGGDGRLLVGTGDKKTLINSKGDLWRSFRVNILIPYSGKVFAGMLVLILVFFLTRGQIKIRSGYSYKKILRYKLFERLTHWLMALAFVVLAVSGSILMLGRSLILPWLDKATYSQIASLSKLVHDYSGPIFAFTIVVMFFAFVGRNIYAKGDLMWLLKGGGMIGNAHVPSGFFNMGEKSLFWILIFVGGALSITGLLMAFPVIELGRLAMTLLIVVHAICAIVMILTIMGHIYIGTVGMQGALDGMKTGYCDLNWAKEHHQDWTEKVEDQAIPK